MSWLREVWSGVRETVFVTAQVVTLGVLALVLGLLALNVLTHQPAAKTPVAGPSRPLASLVATLVPDTPTPQPSTTPAPGASPTTAAAAPSPTAPLFALPTAQPQGAAPATPIAAAPPPPTAPTPVPPAPTATPQPAGPTATSAVPGQLMKVLPAADGLPARVRAEPTTKSPILVRVPLGATVEVIGTASGDELQPGNARWLRIKWKDVTGYVYSTLLGEQ